MTELPPLDSLPPDERPKGNSRDRLGKLLNVVLVILLLVLIAFLILAYSTPEPS